MNKQSNSEEASSSENVDKDTTQTEPETTDLEVEQEKESVQSGHDSDEVDGDLANTNVDKDESKPEVDRGSFQLDLKSSPNLHPIISPTDSLDLTGRKLSISSIASLFSPSTPKTLSTV